jgi:hypothetical protein
MEIVMTINVDGTYGSGREAWMAASGADAAAKSATSERAGKTAAEYYDQLRDTFSNLKISQGCYTPGTVAGSGTGNVMIDPAYVEKAASDPGVAAELERNLADIPAAERWLKNMCAASGAELVSGGVVIDANGGMSSWSVVRTATGEGDDKRTREKTLTEFLEEARKKRHQKHRKAEEADSDDENRNDRKCPTDLYFQDEDDAWGTRLFDSKA